MDRIINVSVGGNYLKKDNKNAGVRGEANVTMLRIAFDEGWDNFAKTVTFLDARGLNPVNVMLGVNLLEDRRVYLVPIPAEPMAVAGWLTFIVEGALNNKVQRSFADKLEVKDAPDTDDAVNAVDPVPSEVEQFQTEIEYIKENVQGAIEANKAIQNMSVSAETLKAGEQAFVEKTEKDGVVNLHYGLPAGGKGDKGEKGDSGKSAYEIALSKGFKGTEEEWVDWLRNGVDGKDGNPGVYVGTGEMPEGYSVQIDPSGDDTAMFSEIAQTTGNSESAVMSQKAATDAIRTVEAIAKGRSSGYVFTDEAEMREWIRQGKELHSGKYLLNYDTHSPYIYDSSYLSLGEHDVVIVGETPNSDMYYWADTHYVWTCWAISTNKFYCFDGDSHGLYEASEEDYPSLKKLTKIQPISLQLGDNLYIRDTTVPDYWWDGSEPQPLETKFVDVDQYVKKTDAEVLFVIRGNNNIVPPEQEASTYNDSYVITKNFITIEKEKVDQLYLRTNPDIANVDDVEVKIFLYENDVDFDAVSIPYTDCCVDDLGTAIALTTYISKIRVEIGPVSESNVSIADVCISYNELDEFEPYGPFRGTYLKEEYIPTSITKGKADKKDLEQLVSDIENVLDNIITIQESLIGGETT